ncbi:MAG: 6-bladed beta-propeller [Candidatus Neomarinimicrobiota bacterium]
MVAEHRYQTMMIALIGCILVNLVAAQQVLWPRPPDTTRIVLERVLAEPPAINADRNWWQRLTNLIRPPVRSEFARPMGVDARDGYLAVADPGAGGVFLINLQAGTTVFLEPAAGVSHLFAPLDVCLSEDRIFVTSSLAQNPFVFDYGGDYRGRLDLSADAQRLTGIAGSGSGLYLVDTPGHQVLRRQANGVVKRLISGRGQAAGSLNYPTFVTVGADGSIYISDTMNFRVQNFSPAGTWLATIGAAGVSGGQLNRPKGVAVDGARRLYVVDNSFDNVQIFAADGSFLMHFGATGSGQGQFYMPTDIAIDGDLIYVSDTMNNRIQVFRKLYE